MSIDGLLFLFVGLFLVALYRSEGGHWGFIVAGSICVIVGIGLLWRRP